MLPHLPNTKPGWLAITRPSAALQEAKTVRFANSDAPVFHDDVDNAADYIDDVMDNEELSITDRTF